MGTNLCWISLCSPMVGLVLSSCYSSVQRGVLGPLIALESSDGTLVGTKCRGFFFCILLIKGIHFYFALSFIVLNYKDNVCQEGYGTACGAQNIRALNPKLPGHWWSSTDLTSDNNIFALESFIYLLLFPVMLCILQCGINTCALNETQYDMSTDHVPIGYSGL